MKEEEWKKVIDINLTSTFLITKNVIKKMLKFKNGKMVKRIPKIVKRKNGKMVKLEFGFCIFSIISATIV